MHVPLLSRVLFTADHAWMVLLISAVFLAWEFVRPGRIFPGILGGTGVMTALIRLFDLHPAPRAVIIGVAAILLLAAAPFTRRSTLTAISAATLGTISGRLLFPDPAPIGWLPVILTGPVILILASMLSLAGRAWRNKRDDLSVSAR